MRSDRTDNFNYNKSTVIKAILLGTVIGVLLFFILIALFSFIFLKAGSLPYDFVTIITLIIGSIGAFFSGYFSVKILKEKGLIYGCITGFILFFVIYIIGSIAFQEVASIKTLLRCLVMVLAGSIGGVIVVNKRNRR